MDAAMSAAGRSRPGSRRTSMLGGATPSMRPVGRDTPRSRLHNQLNTPGMYDSAPIIPDFDLVGPKSSWDGESVATTRAGSTRPPPHPHTTPRHAMQATVEDAPPSGFTSARPSPLHSGAIIESKRNSDMETVQEEPVAGPSAFPHVVLSVDPPEGDPSRSRPSSRRAGSSGRTRDEQLHQDSGWDDFDTHAPATSGWGDFGGGDGWPGGFNVGGHAGGSGWPDEPPPLASGLGLSGATASQQGSRRPSDASLYVQDPILPQTPARSRAHSRAPSGSGLSQMARSPPGATAPLLAPPQVRSPTLSDVHGANMFHVPVAGSPPLGSPTHQVASPPRSHPIRTNITPTRSNATPSRSVRPTPIARDYALPEGHRTIPLAADGTPRFPQHVPVPAGVSTPGRALRDAMFMGNGTPRHPAAARQAQPEPEPEPEPEPPQEPPQEDEPAAPGKKSFLSRVSSMLNRDRNIQKDKPPAPRKVKKKKGKAAVEEMLAEEWAPEAGPSTLGDAPPLAEHDPAEEERKRVEEEEARRKAEEDERRRKEEAEEALKAAEEAARLESERRRQEEEERRLRDEEEERLARERAEAVEAEHAQVLSQHGDAPPPDPPAAAVDEQADKGEGGGGGWGIFKRRGTKKKKGAQKPPTPPPPEPSPFNLPPLPAAAAAADAPPPPASVPPSPQGTFAAPPPQRTFAVPPSPIRPLQQSPRPTLDTTVHGHAPTLIEFSGAPHEEHREYVYVPSNATPTPAHRRGASTIHAVPAPATRRSPTHVSAGTAASQTPRLPSTYTMPFPHSHGPGRSPLPRVASGASGAMAFRVPPRSPTGTTTAPATPSVPSAQLLAEHAKVLGALEGAEAARDRAFLQNEERRARLFDEAEDRRRQEAEARRRVIEVWV